LHVHDHCRAIECVLTRAASGTTWNVGGGSPVENIWLVGRLCEVVEQAFARAPGLRQRFPNCPAARSEPCANRMRFVPDRPGHDRRYALDGSRVERELGFHAGIGLDQGLAATVAWYLDNASWWRAVKDGTQRRGLPEAASPSP
jgi:dTDP-glucose 4,6-dehydratase